MFSFWNPTWSSSIKSATVRSPERILGILSAPEKKLILLLVSSFIKKLGCSIRTAGDQLVDEEPCELVGFFGRRAPLLALTGTTGSPEAAWGFLSPKPKSPPGKKRQATSLREAEPTRISRKLKLAPPADFEPLSRRSGLQPPLPVDYSRFSLFGLTGQECLRAEEQTSPLGFPNSAHSQA